MSKTEQTFNLHNIDSPIGTLLLVTDVHGTLRALDFHDYEARMHRLLRKHYGAIALTRIRTPHRLHSIFDRYFTGDIAALDALECATNGTQFQQMIWAALRRIEAGQAITYGQLAARLRISSAARAVGFANGANPIAIVVPCHRLIGANGHLTGYAGGLHRKRWLLDHERRALR